MPAPFRERRPWPMKWIVLAIVVVIVPYTYLTLHYRRPGKAFQPYADLKDRVNTRQLLSGGFQRITLGAQRPADPKPSLLSASITQGAGGLPAVLRSSLADEPKLPAEILSVSAPSAVATGEPYLVQFSCTLPDTRHQLAGASLYLRNQEIFLVPNFEPTGADLVARTRESVVQLTVPAGALKPGSYHAAILGERASKSWTLQVH
ncbi:MAG: hypothetical protein ABIZ81_09765 [Opitutaceae bacterium]